MEQPRPWFSMLCMWHMPRYHFSIIHVFIKAAVILMAFITKLSLEQQLYISDTTRLWGLDIWIFSVLSRFYFPISSLFCLWKNIVNKRRLFRNCRLICMVYKRFTDNYKLYQKCRWGKTSHNEIHGFVSKFKAFM